MRVMQKLVTYDEPRELERLNDLWRGLDPNGTWLYRHGPPEHLEKASMWDHPNEATCLACELKLGRRMAWEAREAMARIIWSDYSSDSEKEDEIGMGQGAVAISSEGGHRTPRPRRMRFLTGIMMELVREPLAF
ncbi:hypothetical protein PG993_015258 [Apiospora rasikravindrae]|uniref:Uncharacterized protein n=1 Tax=Apiospora rasikravindrae TaxID=990691 RepID=A0ABR1RQ15_9PEZI